MKREKRTGEQLSNKMILQAKIVGVEISCEYCKHKQDWLDSIDIFKHQYRKSRYCKVYKQFPDHYILSARYKWIKEDKKKVYFQISRFPHRYDIGSNEGSNYICKRWIAGRNK